MVLAYRDRGCTWLGFVFGNVLYVVYTGLKIYVSCDIGRDRLSLRQHEWLRILAQTGVKAEICHVSCD